MIAQSYHNTLALCAHVQVLRAYARFVEGVNNDPWAAAKYFA